MGAWKLVHGKHQDELFNLLKDAGETTDLNKRHPKVLDRLVKLWEANQIKKKSPSAIPTTCRVVLRSAFHGCHNHIPRRRRRPKPML